MGNVSAAVDVKIYYSILYLQNIILDFCLQKFLERFGYISNEAMNMRRGRKKDEMVREGLKMYQAYAGVHVTGTLNDETMAMMNSPRCGNDDMGVIMSMKETNRRKR